MVQPNTNISSSQASGFLYAGAGPSSDEEDASESETDTVTKGGDNKDDDEDFMVDEDEEEENNVVEIHQSQLEDGKITTRHCYKEKTRRVTLEVGQKSLQSVEAAAAITPTTKAAAAAVSTIKKGNRNGNNRKRKSSQQQQKKRAPPPKKKRGRPRKTTGGTNNNNNNTASARKRSATTATASTTASATAASASITGTAPAPGSTTGTTTALASTTGTVPSPGSTTGTAMAPPGSTTGTAPAPCSTTGTAPVLASGTIEEQNLALALRLQQNANLGNVFTEEEEALVNNASTTSMNYCAADLIPFSGIMSNDSPLPDTIVSNAAGTIFHTNIPIESFPPRPDTVYSEFDLIIKKKKWDRIIEHNKLDNYFANPDLFIEGNCNGDYPDLKKAADPDDTSGITLLDGSRVRQEIIDNVFLPGEFMSHITPACNLKNSPRDRTIFYDSSEHGALEGGILQHGLKRFTTIEGHKEESHINGVWMLPGSRIKSGIQHVCKNHNNDLMYSNNKVGVVICRKDDPELKKLRPFPLCSTWAQRIHPAYSLENMEVNPEFIFIVDTQNIPQFFDHILGHPDLIDLQTQEQKKETQRKYYYEGGGKEKRKTYYYEGGGKERGQEYYYEGGGKERGQERKRKWYYEDGGKEIKQRYDHQRRLTATEKSFNKFITSGVLPEPLQCDCGKKYHHSYFQIHIAACPYMKKGFRSSQQLIIKSLGMSATSCKEDRILWLKLRSVWSRVKAMNLPLSVSDFIVHLFNNARQQERVDRLKKMIECEKMRKESAQDKASIANIEIVLAEIELQQENKENPPTMVFDDIPDDGYDYKKIEEGPDVLLVSDKYLRKVLRKNNLPTDGIRTTLLGRLNAHNKQKKPHKYADYW